MTDFYGVPGIGWSSLPHDEVGPQANHELVAAAPEGHSLYVTDILISVEGPEGYVFLVEGTGEGAPVQRTIKFYIAQYGGIPIRLVTPLKITAGKNVGFTSVGVLNHGVQIMGYTA